MSDTSEAFFAGVVMTFTVMSLLWGWTLKNTNDSWRQQIADHGCAEFYLDQNHDRQWRWKDYDKTIK